MFEKGKITLSQLQRNAKNILRYLMSTHAFERFIENGGVMMKSLTEDMDSLEVSDVFENVESGDELALSQAGRCLACITYSSDELESAQIRVDIKINGVSADGVAAKGTLGKKQIIYRDISVGESNSKLELVYPKDQMKIHRVEIRK